MTKKEIIKELEQQILEKKNQKFKVSDHDTWNDWYIAGIRLALELLKSKK